MTGAGARTAILAYIDWRRPSVMLALVTLALHLLTSGRYGFFLDELYFIVCGQHLAWGYVDQPPLVPLIAWLSRAVFGDFLPGFRLVPALVWAATVMFTAEFARLLGGGRFAQWLAGLCALLAPVYLTLGLFVYTDVMQPLVWLGVSWCLVRLVQTGNERWWIALGAIVAFGLWSKYAIAFYILALGLGALVTPLRFSLVRPWVYAGAALALVLIAPNIFWQWSQGWPFVEVVSAGVNGKNLALSPLEFFKQQILLMGPLSAPVWLAGLWAFGVRPAHPSFRVFPAAYILLFVYFVAQHGKANYLVPIYTVLFGGGAVYLEAKFRSVALRSAALAVIALTGLTLLPLAVPVLTEEAYIAYAAALGFGPSSTAGDKQARGRLPQHFADMHGWREMAEKVAVVYHALPPSERAHAVFFGRDYAEASAIDVFGPKLGLPSAISGHNQYWLWGPRGHEGSVMIVVGGDPDNYAREFRSVEKVGWIDTPYAMPAETNIPIYVLRGPKTPLPKLWPQLKHFG